MTFRIVTLALLVLSSAADAQCVGSCIGQIGRNGAGAPSPPPVACGAGQLDFSDSCNTTLYMVMLR